MSGDFAPDMALSPEEQERLRQVERLLNPPPLRVVEVKPEWDGSDLEVRSAA